MAQFKLSVLALVLMASSSQLGGHAFVLSGGRPSGVQTQLQASSPSDDSLNEINFKNAKQQIVGGTTAFVAGLVFATQVAFADTSVLLGDNNIGK